MAGAVHGEPGDESDCADSARSRSSSEIVTRNGVKQKMEAEPSSMVGRGLSTSSRENENQLRGLPNFYDSVEVLLPADLTTVPFPGKYPLVSQPPGWDPPAISPVTVNGSKYLEFDWNTTNDSPLNGIIGTFSMTLSDPTFNERYGLAFDSAKFGSTTTILTPAPGRSIRQATSRISLPPKIDPGSIGAGLTLLIGGALALTGRRRRPRSEFSRDQVRSCYGA